MSVSSPAPPKRLARGSAPFVSSRVITSLRPWPNTWMKVVLATVGVPPAMGIAPLFTRIVPAASRLIVIVLAPLSPKTVSTPLVNVAVVAALAGELAASTAPAAPRCR